MKAVVFGAGNIGRGFLGQLFSQSGYEIVFVEVATDIINRLNTDRAYPIHIVGEKNWTYRVEQVTAVHAADVDTIREEIGTANLLATAVGVNALPAVAPTIAGALRSRLDDGNVTALNVIICENVIHSGEHLKRLVLRHVPQQYHRTVEEKVGWVATVVSRMVPVVTEEMKRENPAQISVEPYCILPVDKKAFKDPLPKIEGFKFADNLPALEERKLYAHNAGHALCAYFGHEKRYTYIYEAIADPEIRRKTLMGLNESGRALCKKHGFSPKEYREHIDDLLRRFGNVALGDTIARVARDPIRKLGRQDRLIGSALLALEYEVKLVYLLEGIVAALRYTDPEDEKALRLQQLLADEGIAHVLETVCGLDSAEPLHELIFDKYQSSRRSRKVARHLKA
jgi:mannitol-1-phosphate 5-dehydrogenase